MSGFREALLKGQLPAQPVSDFGLKGRKMVHVAEGNCGVLIDRKSRYLRKDALAFLEIKKAVEGQLGSTHQGWVMVRTAPLCSKAKALLEDAGVNVEALKA